MNEPIIAPALESEVAACLALIPEADRWPVEFLVAKRDRKLIGAAAVRWRNQYSPAGFPISVHVIPPERRRGVGRRLFEVAKELATGETPGLWSIGPLAENLAATSFATDLGFSRARRERHFEVQADRVRELVSPVVSRLRARGQVPDDLKFVTLSESPLDKVARLISGPAGAPSAEAIERLLRYVRSPNGVHDRSRVALRGAEAEGVIIWRRREQVALVEMWAVQPRNRGWLGVLLIADGLARGQAEGVERLRFHCDEEVRETISLAQRCGAAELETRDYYYRPLANIDGSASTPPP